MHKCQHLTDLKHFIWRWFNPRHHVGRGKGYLLHLSKVVAWVTIQDQFSNGNERVLGVRPDLQGRNKMITCVSI